MTTPLAQYPDSSQRPLLSYLLVLLSHLLVLGLDRIPWMGEVLIPHQAKTGV